MGNNTKVNVGTQNLIDTTYEARTSNLMQSNYGNDQKVSSEYDSLDRVTVKKYKGTADDNFNTRNTYLYDASGNLAYNQDLVNGVSYRYIYDNADRLTEVQDSNGNKYSYGYDNNNNASSLTDKINNVTHTTSYVYDNDNRPTETDLAGGGKVTQSYESNHIGRVDVKTINTGSTNFNTTHTYLPGANGSTSTKIDTMSNGTLAAIAYTYDANGNIETMTQGGNQIKYNYNELNEVIREDNQVLNKTIVYAYDAGGNITSKTEYAYTTGTLGTPTKTISYSYGDTNWKDKLTSYDGKAITYDAIGNPLTYDGWTYTWEEGRQLKTAVGNGHNISYKYNDSGIRTQKIVDGVTTNYHLVGDRVTYENNGTDAIYYSYDASGNIVSMNLNGTEYYYVRNAQGDITGLIDGSGTQVVSYTYDTWGKIVSTTGTLASTVGVKNPYRYRGYRFDTETGLYYLQGRYYNADWGRFVNADAAVGGIGELVSHNLFAYCLNNPVNLSDPSGNWPSWVDSILNAAISVVNAIVGAVASSVSAASSFVYAQMKDLGKGWSYREEGANESTREKEHVHVNGGGKKYQQDVDGGRRTKENPTGLPNPPATVRERLKGKIGWDWDANAAKPTADKIATTTAIAGGAYLLYRTVRMVPSFAPPLWWTIPANIAIP